MPKSDTPRLSDDRDTAEHQSRSVDERVPDHHIDAADPLVLIPGAFGTNIPQGGLGATDQIAADELGPGEEALAIERKAQRAHLHGG